MIPFIVTLATGQIFTGIIYVITQGHPILDIPESAVQLGRGMLFGVIPFPTIAMIVFCIVLAYVMRYTPLEEMYMQLVEMKKLPVLQVLKQIMLRLMYMEFQQLWHPSEEF